MRKHFEVKVTGCMNCPHIERQTTFGGLGNMCLEEPNFAHSFTVAAENYHELKPSCPHWGEVKEK